MDPDDHIPSKFFLKLWPLLSKALPGKNISLELAKIAPFALMGSPWRIMKLAPDLRTMIELFVQNYDLFSDQLDVKLIDTASGVALRIDHVLDDFDEGVGVELGFGIVLQIIQKYFGDGVFTRVQFRHTARSPMAVYEDYFRVPIFFQAPFNATIIRREALDYPNKESWSEEKSSLKRSFSRLSEEFGAGDADGLEDVRMAIEHQAKKDDYTVKGLARHMNVTVRSLQRLIRASGGSARTLLNEARYNKAIELLADESINIEEVAFRLDFDSERTFRRAFKRWANKTPSQFRRERRKV